MTIGTSLHGHRCNRHTGIVHPGPPGSQATRREEVNVYHQTAVIHAVCAIVFIVFLAVMSFLFAASEVLPEKDRIAAQGRSKPSSFRRRGLFWTHSACALIILAAGAWAFAGAGIWKLTPLYIGEVVSVWAFGVSWLVAGFYLTAPARTKMSAETRDLGAASAAASS